MVDQITLYFPGDGVRETSNCVLYKSIKDFKQNDDGTITFKTQKFGTITTALPWRLAKDVPATAGVDHEEDAVPAGNRANRVRW